MAIYSMEGTQNDCYPGTTVLINKLNIRDQAILDVAERTIVVSMMVKAERETPFEHVNFAFYKSLHQKLFEDLYAWAGKTRTINLSKKGTVFCNATDIDRIGTAIFSRLADMKHLQNLSKDVFLDELTALYHDLNILHPFREGNGRTLRLFVTLLVRNAGYNVSFAECDSDLLMIATIRAAQGDSSLLKDVFSELIQMGETK